MSSEGRRRVVFSGLKTAGFVAVLAGLAWGGIEVGQALQNDSRKAPVTAQSSPVKDLVLVTDGVLDQAWAARILALPKNTPLMALDLLQLRTRLLADGQVRTASLTRNFPSTLAINLTERLPVVRLQAQDKDDQPRTLLVARDGVVFEGAGYDARMLATIPWLAGVKLTRQGGVFQPIPGMAAVADLLGKAKLEADHLYSTWRVVSLARLESDGEIDIGTRDGTRVTFATTEDYFRQLANLDTILDAARAHPDKPLREINLAVGQQVPVAFESAASTAPAPLPRPAATPAPALKLPVFPVFSTH